MVSSSVNELDITHLEYLSKCFEGVPAMGRQIPSRKVPETHKLYGEIGKLQRSEMIHWDPCRSRMQEIFKKRDSAQNCSEMSYSVLNTYLNYLNYYLNLNTYLTFHLFSLSFVVWGFLVSFFNKNNRYIYKQTCFFFSVTVLRNNIIMTLYINHYIYLLKVYLKMCISISVMCGYVIL